MISYLKYDQILKVEIMPNKESNILQQKWQSVLSKLVQNAELMAQSSQRKRNLSVEQLVQTLVLGCLEGETVSLRLWSEIAGELGVEISASSIDERLTKRVVLLVYTILQDSIKEQVDVPDLPIEQLKSLSRMILYDSTALKLPPILKWAFPALRETGLGHMKVQVAYDYLNAQLQALSIHQANEPDQRDGGLLEQVCEDALLIFDLGYFDQEVLLQIDEGGAYFATRYQTQTGLYDCETGHRVILAEQLQACEGNYFESQYRLGAEAKVLIRLVARRVSPQEAEKRRRGLKRKAKQGGYTASQNSLGLGDWEIIISNLPMEWTAQQILDLYRIRCQIELIFKAWKSYLDLSDYGYWRAERVLCQLFATLIGAVLCHSSFAIVRFINTETSLFKAIRVIRRHVIRLSPILGNGGQGISAWADDLCQALLKFAQQQQLETMPSSLGRLLHWALT